MECHRRLRGTSHLQASRGEFFCPATASCGLHLVAAVPCELDGIAFATAMYRPCEAIQGELAAFIREQNVRARASHIVIGRFHDTPFAPYAHGCTASSLGRRIRL